jgi:hypothetical protein
LLETVYTHLFYIIPLIPIPQSLNLHPGQLSNNMKFIAPASLLLNVVAMAAETSAQP